MSLLAISAGQLFGASDDNNDRVNDPAFYQTKEWYEDRLNDYWDQLGVVEAVQKFTNEYVPKDKYGMPIGNFQDFLAKQPSYSQLKK